MNRSDVDEAGIKRCQEWQQIEVLDQQRRYPRIPLNAKTEFITDSGRKFSGEIINISPDGLQLRCAMDVAPLIRPQGCEISALDASCATTSIPLALGHGTQKMAVRCQTLYLTTIESELQCVAGMRFVQLALESERILNAFFADQLMHDETTAEIA